MADPIEIGSRLEPFVDDFLIDRMDGVTLKMHNPEPKNVVLKFDRPWEGDISWAGSVTKEGDRYRMWYLARRPGESGQGRDPSDRQTSYAESRDGINWTRPSLGQIEHDGSTDNNIVAESFTCVFRDENPAAPDSERYKAISPTGRVVDGRLATILGYTSPDGMRWTAMAENPLLVAPDDIVPIFDSPNIAFWDPLQGQYQLFARGWPPVPNESMPGHNGGYRSIRRSVSTDFRNWTEPEFIDMGDSPAEHLYTNAATPYFRAPHIYLMFPKRFTPVRKVFDDAEDGLSECVFMTSRDGVHWDRRFMEAFIRPGLDPNNWNERNMGATVGVVPTGDDEVSLYIVENYRHPTVFCRRYALRTDGFVSVNAGWGGGELVTQPIVFEGSRLAINYSTSVAGHVRIQVEGDGVSLDSGEMFGDEIERTVQWDAGDLSGLAGKPVRLRIGLKEADLYSIRFD